MLRCRRRHSSAELVANQARIRSVAERAATDLDALAALFEDDGIADDGTVAGRVWAILIATERGTIPGLRTAVPFGDAGFRGERRPGGYGLRDPWPASRNQVGHCLTAVGLALAPDIVSRPIFILGSIRRIVGARATMADRDVALRLTIGHEKITDPPNPVEAGLLILAQGLIAARRAIARDGTFGERAARIAAAMLMEACYQLVGSLETFRAQYRSTTAEDVAAWQDALRICGDGCAIDWPMLESKHSPLNAIAVGRGEGNSIQDLRLSLAGWLLGQLIESGAFSRRQDVAAWLRRTLG